MKKNKLILLIVLMAATCLSTYAQKTFTYHYIVKDQGVKVGERMPDVFKPDECFDLIQFSYTNNSADWPYFDGENAVCPAANDGGPKGGSFYLALTDKEGIYAIKDLEIVMGKKTNTTIQCELTNDSKPYSTKEACPESFKWTDQKITHLTFINNGPEPFYIKEIILTVGPYEQSDTCELHIPHFEGFEKPIFFHGTRVPSSCWNTYHKCQKSVLPDIIGKGTGASYLYDGNFELSMGETANCWSMIVLPEVKTEQGVKNLMMDFFAESIGSATKLEVGVLEDPNDPESFVSVGLVTGETLLTTWYHVFVPFNKYKGAGTRIAIKNTDAIGGLHIDNLSVKEISAAPAPYYVSAKNSDYKKITVDWKDVIPADSWEIELVEQGAAPGSGKSHIVDKHPAVLDVEANHNYDIYVKAYYTTGTSENAEMTSIHTPSCPESEMCTYTVTWSSDVNIGSLNNMIRVYINGFLADHLYMPAGETSYKSYIKVCKGDELKLAFKRGSNYTRYTNFIITNPDDEIICMALNGSLSGEQCEIGDVLLYTSYESPFLSLTADCSACKAPTNLSATNIGKTTADIKWTAATPTNDWVIEYGEPGFQHGQGTKVDVTASPFTLEGLTPATEYELFMYTRCAEEISKESKVILFNTKSECNEPTRFMAQNVTATFVTLKWEAGEGETEWEVRYLGPNESTFTDPVKVSEPTITIENLMSESEYTFNLRGICSEGKYSNWVKLTTKTLQCKKPFNLRISDLASNQATVTWTASNQENKWMVSYKDDAATTWTMKIVTDNPYTMKDLKAETRYSVHVEAFCSEDVMSEPSEDASFNTKADGIEDYAFNPIVLYPSYADDVINVYVNDSQVHATGIEIYDMQGKLLQTLDAQGNNTQVSVSQLSAGLYMVRVQCDKGNFVRKFIKK